MSMTHEEVSAKAEEIIDFLSNKNEEAKEAGIEQHAQFVTSVAFTLGSLIGFDLNPAGYGPMLSAIIESLTDGLQSAATHKGVNATFIKVVHD